MTTQSQPALKRLSTLSTSINRASDELTQQLSEIEGALNRLNLGVVARVHFASTEMGSGGPIEKEEIGYAKLDGKWGLTWATYVNHDPESTWSEKFLREAPRDVRVSAVKVLPQLLDELIMQSEKLAARTAERATEARQIAASLKTSI